MTNFLWTQGEFDSIGGTPIWHFVQCYFDTAPIEEIVNNNYYPEHERLAKIKILLWDNPDLNTYRESMLLLGKECLKQYEIELQDYPGNELKAESISRHMVFLDNAIFVGISHLRDYFHSKASRPGKQFSPYSFTEDDLVSHNRIAAILEHILQIQINVIHFLKSELSLKYPIYQQHIQYQIDAKKPHVKDIQSSKHIKLLTWDDNKFKMEDFFKLQFAKGFLRSPIEDDFPTIMKIISSKIKKASQQFYNPDLLKNYRGYKVIWIGKRVKFVETFFPLYEKKIIFIDSHHRRDTMARALHDVFWFKNNKPRKGSSEELGVGTFINDFKQYDHDREGFLIRQY